VQEGRAITGLESGAQRARLIERHPEGIDVGPQVARTRLAANLLGTHVPQGAHQVTRACRPCVVACEARQAEIGHPELPTGVDDQVGSTCTRASILKYARYPSSSEPSAWPSPSFASAMTRSTIARSLMIQDPRLRRRGPTEDIPPVESQAVSSDPQIVLRNGTEITSRFS